MGPLAGLSGMSGLFSVGGVTSVATAALTATAAVATAFAAPAAAAPTRHGARAISGAGSSATAAGSPSRGRSGSANPRSPGQPGSSHRSPAGSHGGSSPAPGAAAAAIRRTPGARGAPDHDSIGPGGTGGSPTPTTVDPLDPTPTTTPGTAPGPPTTPPSRGPPTTAPNRARAGRQRRSCRAVPGHTSSSRARQRHRSRRRHRQEDPAIVRPRAVAQSIVAGPRSGSRQLPYTGTLVFTYRVCDVTNLCSQARHRDVRPRSLTGPGPGAPGRGRLVASGAMDRREFLRLGAMAGAAGALAQCSSGSSKARRLPGPTTTTTAPRLESVLDGAPADSGIDTVVVCMMENRSFDSYFGWLARDEHYLEQGRSRYGAKFAINGNSFQQFPGRPTASRSRRSGACCATSRNGGAAATTRIRATSGTRDAPNETAASWRPAAATTSSRSPTSKARIFRSTTCSRVVSPFATAGTRRCSGRRIRIASTCSRRNRAATRPTTCRSPKAGSSGRTSSTGSRLRTSTSPSTRRICRRSCSGARA